MSLLPQHPEKYHRIRDFFDADFFRELMIVACGLLIALFLNGLVGDYRSYRLAQDTQSALQKELESNIRLLRKDAQSCDQLSAELSALSHAIEQHRSGLPTPFLTLHFDYHPALDLVWITAQSDRAVELLPLSEQRRDAERYRLGSQLTENWQRVVPPLYETQSIMLQGSLGMGDHYGLDNLSNAQVESLGLSVARARYALAIFRDNLLSNIRFYDAGEKR